MNSLLIRHLKFQIVLLITFFALNLSAQTEYVRLQEGFRNPPDAAKPRTWWHWTNSNITKEGITKDLEWMKRAGIGGMQLADVASGQGQTVEKKLLFMSPEWLDAVKHAASEAERLGLELTMFSSAGWSLTGGPWVKPEEAMKKLVWSETNIDGPNKFNAVLQPPPTSEGPFGNMGRTAPNASFYKDCLVLAFRTPDKEEGPTGPAPVVTTAAGVLDARPLMDNDLNTSARIRTSKTTGENWLQYSFDRPYRAQAITIASRNGIPFCTLTVSDDGKVFRRVTIMPGPQLYRAGKVETVTFPETVAKFYRIEFTGAPWKPAEVMAETDPKPDTVYVLNEVTLHPGARINRWEDKAGFFHLFNYDPITSSSTSSNPLQPSSYIDPKEIVDLTGKMDQKGVLNWDVPKGKWTVMRFGYSLTGSKNRPAVPSGLGYEVDKLSRENTISYLKGFTDPIKQALGPLYGKGLSNVLLDSWEAGMQNWTDKMIEEFRARRGYDPTPFLPAMAGWVVENPEISDRFLWDFRRTLADMFAENHFSTVTDYLRKQGISTYGEVSGVSLEILEDALLSKKYVDIPMGEFWFRSLHPDLMYYQDVRGAASASHIYGKKFVAAESFTGGGFESPWSLKKIGDYWFAQGLNRIIFHTSAHQPLDTKPGNTMVGTHINRNITWAEQAKPFMTYLARNSFMLQQGKFVADIAYLLDEGAPSTMPIWGTGLIPAPPEGYDFDYVNADALLTRMNTVSDGKIILPDSMTYSVLVLPNTEMMTVPVLSKLHELVKNGATILGRRPLRTPGLNDYPSSEIRLKELADDLWGDLDGISRTRHPFGKGQVVWGMPLSSLMEMLKVPKDLEYSRPLDAEISWIHRRTNDIDIYFIVNRTDKELRTDVRFRVNGREAGIWDPVTGQVTPASYSSGTNSTVVPLQLTERQSLFVVLHDESTGSGTVSPKVLTRLTSLEGPWEISFPQGLGAPAKSTMNRLESWTKNSDQGIKYFSGTATYTISVNAPANWFQKDTRLILDLGWVGDLAEVIVNGKPVDTLWSFPFRCDITGLFKKGKNKLELKVTNQWTNRLAGDRVAKPGEKVLNSSLFARGNQLNDSGLLGPVTINLEK